MKLFLFLPYKSQRMKGKNWIKTLAVVLLTLVGLVSCGHKEPMIQHLLGHWGCERYICCRTTADGVEHWDTLHYQVGEGHGYEFWFRADGSGKFRMNDSPALIKEVSITYELDEDQNQIVIHGSTFFYLFYASQYFEENEARFNIETLNDTVLNVHWTNLVSENTPFYENFYLRKIIN